MKKKVGKKHKEVIEISSDSETLSTVTKGEMSEFPIPSISESTITIPEETATKSGTETAHSAVDMDTDGIPILQEAIDTKPHQILIFSWNRNKISVKNLSREKQKILEVHLPTNREDLVTKFLKEHINPKVKHFLYFEEEIHRRQFAQAAIKLFKKGTVKLYECTKRVTFIENEEEQRQIVLRYQDSKTCHRGINETLMKLKRTYFWDNMNVTVASVINACETCKTIKYDRKPFKPELQLTQTQDRPFQELFIDLFSVEGKYFLTIIDAFSKLGQAIKISNRSTPEVIRALIKYFSYYGIPHKISADAGSEINNTLMKETLNFCKINLHIDTPHNPNSMGLIERFHSTILEIYRIAKYEQKLTDAASVMAYAVMSYNYTIHSATNLTPFEVVFGHTDSSNIFNVEFNKHYTQKLVADHATRMRYLYRYLTDKMTERKEIVQKKKGG